jgi:hypothetical protein
MRICIDQDWFFSFFFDEIQERDENKMKLNLAEYLMVSILCLSPSAYTWRLHYNLQFSPQRVDGFRTVHPAFLPLLDVANGQGVSDLNFIRSPLR